MPPSIRHILPLVFSLAPAIGANAQCIVPSNTSNPAPYTLQTEAHAVTVDVVVADKNKRPRTDLVQGNFHLAEDAAPQNIRSFQLLGLGSGRDDKAPVNQLHPHEGRYSNISPVRAGQSIDILLLDTLNTSIEDQQRSRKEVASVLGSLPPGQPVALYTLGASLHMVQDFTQKPDVLIEAAHQLSSHSSPFYVAHGPDQIREDDSLSGADVMKELKMKQAGTAESAKMASEAIDRAFAERGSQRMDVRVQTTIAALAQIAQVTAAYPGRKRLIWLSGSFPLSLSGDAGSSSGLLRDYGPQIHKLATLLGDSQIAVYAMDVHGLATIGADASTAGADATSSRSSAQASSPFNERQENGINAGHATLSEIAEQTGGRAFINRNDIGTAVKEALQDGTAYYDLSYTPTNTLFEGKYRAIELRVDGAKSTDLQYRRGYYALPDIDQGSDLQRREAFRSAMQMNSPESSAVPIVADLRRSTSGELQLTYTVDVHGLKVEQDKNCQNKLDLVIGVVAWKDSGEPQREFKVLNQPMSQTQFDNVELNGLQAQKTLSIAQSPAVVKVGVMDLKTGRFGTLNIAYDGSEVKP